MDFFCNNADNKAWGFELVTIGGIGRAMSDNENQLTDFLAGLSEERRFALKDFFLDKHFDDARAVELLQELYGNTYQALSSSQKLPDDVAAKLFDKFGYTKDSLQQALSEME